MDFLLLLALQKAVATAAVDPAYPVILAAFIATLPATVTAGVAAVRAGKTPDDLDRRLSHLSTQLAEHTTQDDSNFRSLQVGQARMEGRMEEVLKSGR